MELSEVEVVFWGAAAVVFWARTAVAPTARVVARDRANFMLAVEIRSRYLWWTKGTGYNLKSRVYKSGGVSAR